MIRLGKKVFSSVLASVAAVSLAACGGGSHSTLPRPAPLSSTAPVYNGPLTNATFKITIPAPTKSSAKARTPAYISAATKSVRINMTTSTLIPSPPAQFNVVTPVTNASGNAPGSPCAGSGPWTCTISMMVPPGSDTFTFTTYDDTAGVGNILSQQIKTLTVVVGIANGPSTDPAFTVTFDANTGTVNVLGSQACQAGTVIASSYGSVGTSPVTLNVQLLDLAGKTIVDPGKPLLSILDTASSTYKTSGRITGTGMTYADFTVNQSTQTFQLTPSSSTVTGVTVSVKAVPATTTDGLPQGGVFKSFTFSTGPAPGSGFMAAVESTGAFTGQVDLFTVTLVNNGTDQISPYATSGGGTTLARTASLNEAGHFDVDNPEGLQFDTNGDLLIANGGSTTGGDTGNLACVPAGSIATGLANATTNSTNVDLGSPQNPLAYLTDGTAVLANNPTNAPVQTAAFALSGNYVYSATRSYTASGYGAYAVLALPAGTSPYSDGSYAVALTDGIDNQHVDPNPPHNPMPGKNKVTIVQPSGATTDLTDTTVGSAGKGINVPFSLAWDSVNKELVVANQSSHTLNVAWFSLNPFSKKTSINTNLNHYLAATAGNGYTAVAGSSANGEAQIQIFKNDSPTRTLQGIIPYNYFVTGCSGAYVYPASVVTSMLWLSNTKLLVGLKTSDSSKRGLYIYDINQTQTNPGCDDQTGATEPNGPKATVFHQLTNTPLGTAYKP